jgi:hypothetical protein
MLNSPFLTFKSLFVYIGTQQISNAASLTLCLQCIAYASFWLLHEYSPRKVNRASPSELIFLVKIEFEHSTIELIVILVVSLLQATFGEHQELYVPKIDCKSREDRKHHYDRETSRQVLCVVLVCRHSYDKRQEYSWLHPGNKTRAFIE